MTEPAGLTRRRGETLQRAIFDAVIEQLRDVGYAGLTMEGVASCAQTGKAALYRRWPSKNELVFAVLHELLPSPDDLPDTGDLRADIMTMLKRMQKVVNSPSGCAIQSIISSAKQDHEFVREVHERVIAPRKRLMLEVLRRGAARGVVRPEAVKPLVAEVGPAMIVHQLILKGPPVSDATIRSIVDEVVLPLLRP